METARCKAFLAAVETGSFLKAAEKLQYTPSGVSQLVQALEKEVGFAVLQRSKRGVSLTAEGNILLPAVRDFLKQDERIRQLAADINGLSLGSVTIAAYSSMATHWLPPVIRAFEEAYPHIEIRLIEGIWSEVADWLAQKEADIAFLSQRESLPYEWIPLADDPMLAVLPPNHPLATAKAYPLAQCQEEDFIMPGGIGQDIDVVRLLQRHHLSPHIRFSTLENFAAMAMIEQGLGMSIMNELITKGRICNVVKLPLDPPEHITLGIAVPSLTSASPAVRKFIEYATQMIGAAKGGVP